MSLVLPHPLWWGCGVSSERGSWAKTERADKHINELADLIIAFRKKDPYGVIGEDDPVTGERVGRFQERFPTPRRNVSLIAGDAIHNLRSALDLLYCELVVANAKSVADNDMFPIRGDSQKFEASLPVIKARIGTAAAATLEELKPYHGGNDGFWRLHKLDIADKHRLLLTTVAALHEVIHTVPVASPKDALIQVSAMGVHIAPDDIRAVEDGDELFRLDAEPQGEIKYRFEISIHEPPIAECEPVMSLLDYFATGVRETIKRFEAAGHLTT
jgi:hypothetical protein